MAQQPTPVHVTGCSCQSACQCAAGLAAAWDHLSVLAARVVALELETAAAAAPIARPAAQRNSEAALHVAVDNPVVDTAQRMLGALHGATRIVLPPLLWDAGAPGPSAVGPAAEGQVSDDRANTIRIAAHCRFERALSPGRLLPHEHASSRQVNTVVATQHCGVGRLVSRRVCRGPS